MTEAFLKCETYVFVFVDLGASWFHSDELEMDGTATMIPRRDPIKAVQVFQVSIQFTLFDHWSISINFHHFFHAVGKRCDYGMPRK